MKMILKTLNLIYIVLSLVLIIQLEYINNKVEGRTWLLERSWEESRASNEAIMRTIGKGVDEAYVCKKK